MKIAFSCSSCYQNTEVRNVVGSKAVELEHNMMVVDNMVLGSNVALVHSMDRSMNHYCSSNLSKKEQKLPLKRILMLFSYNTPVGFLGLKVSKQYAFTPYCPFRSTFLFMNHMLIRSRLTKKDLPSLHTR
jgi:hypothetical protein